MLLFAHVHVDIMRPDIYRSVHSNKRNAIGRFYIPKRNEKDGNGGRVRGLLDEFNEAQMNPEDVEHRVQSTSTAAVKMLAKSVMEKLVDDIMDDPFVKHLVGEMPPAKTPFFVQLNEKVKRSDPDNAINYGGDLGETKHESTKMEEDDESLDILGELDRGSMDDKDKNKLLQNTETQELLSRIMENTFFNLISEVAHGEINLNVEPRRMVLPDKIK